MSMRLQFSTFLLNFWFQPKKASKNTRPVIECTKNIWNLETL